MEGRRIVLHRIVEERAGEGSLAGDVRAGLGSRPFVLPSKYFYDARGSRLFERITRLDEYYQTRAEAAILERIAPEVTAALRPRVLVEFGSGSARKTRILLDAMRDAGLLEGYGPVDVSADASRRAAEALVRDYPGLRVEGIIGDFERPHDLPFPGLRRLLAFLGSTIGNFEAPADRDFLRGAASEMTAADGFLVGFDLVKDRETLERAYNDAAGVTASFNRNVLRVINRELGADFESEAFAHRACWDADRERIEMHLVALRDQRIRVPGAGLEVAIAEGETIRTEISRKYTRASARRLVASAGLELARWDTDADELFAVGLCRLA